jgi:ketosteroid isomerase-like protein
MGSDNRPAFQAYLDALLAGDLETIRSSFAEDATWSIHGDLPLSGTRCGRDAILDFLVAAGSLYAPGTQSFVFGEFTAQDDRVVLEWKVRGIGAATGKAYDNDYCGVFTYRGGRIAAVREYFDTDHARSVLYEEGR